MPGKQQRTNWGAAMTGADGHFYWNELLTQDSDGAMAFYRNTLGWGFKPAEGIEGYWVIMQGAEPVGGLSHIAAAQQQPQALPDRWISYLRVGDVDRCVELARAAGGRALRPPFDLPKVGRVALLQDRGGAVIGFVQPESGEDS